MKSCIRCIAEAAGGCVYLPRIVGEARSGECLGLSGGSAAQQPACHLGRAVLVRDPAIQRAPLEHGRIKVDGFPVVLDEARFLTLEVDEVL